MAAIRGGYNIPSLFLSICMFFVGGPDRTKGFDRPEEEEPLSVAQQHLRQLLRRQLSTRTGSVESALHQSREFAPPVTFRQLASEVEGLHSLQQYQTKQEGHGRVDALRELGLTFEEIE